MPTRDRLSDLKCRTSKPGKKTKRLFDGGGLYLELAPGGGKSEPVNEFETPARISLVS